MRSASTVVITFLVTFIISLSSAYLPPFGYRRQHINKTTYFSISKNLRAKESKPNEAVELNPVESKPNTPLIEPLEPFLPAADPSYAMRGEVGKEDFVVSRHGSPNENELSNENLFRILSIQCSDLEVNTLVWKCLGYRFDEENEKWKNDEVFPNWKEKFPIPPDLIGMQRIYSKEIDQPSLKANQQLVRSVPVDFKQSLKKHLRPLGFTGYKYAELTPNKTRRAQCANWLLFYREELFGFTLQELKERRRLKKEAEEASRRKAIEESGEDPEESWKPPVREVF